MIYLTSASGMIGKRFRELYKEDITTISYRNRVYDVFKSHKNSCLIHLAWSSTTRDKDGLKGKYDVFNSQELFKFYSEKNPNGKIIFVSTAGDMHLDHEDDFVYELDNPKPRTVYGKSKLRAEQILDTLKCKTVVLRTSNIWGGKVQSERINGLVDKLVNALDTDKVVEIYANLETCVDLVHIDDFMNLLIKVIHKDFDQQHELFLVGGQTISISDIINKVSKKGSLNLKIDQTTDKSYISIRPSKAERVLGWEREYFL
jgi:UDP-glucose 4-epimerase